MTEQEIRDAYYAQDVLEFHLGDEWVDVTIVVLMPNMDTKRNETFRYIEVARPSNKLTRYAISRTDLMDAYSPRLRKKK